MHDAKDTFCERHLVSLFVCQAAMAAPMKYVIPAVVRWLHESELGTMSDNVFDAIVAAYDSAARIYETDNVDYVILQPVTENEIDTLPRTGVVWRQFIDGADQMVAAALDEDDLDVIRFIFWNLASINSTSSKTTTCLLVNHNLESHIMTQHHQVTVPCDGSDAVALPLNLSSAGLTTVTKTKASDTRDGRILDNYMPVLILLRGYSLSYVIERFPEKVFSIVRHRIAESEIDSDTRGTKRKAPLVTPPHAPSSSPPIDSRNEQADPSVSSSSVAGGTVKRVKFSQDEQETMPGLILDPEVWDKWAVESTVETLHWRAGHVIRRVTPSDAHADYCPSGAGEPYIIKSWFFRVDKDYADPGLIVTRESPLSDWKGYYGLVEQYDIEYEDEYNMMLLCRGAFTADTFGCWRTPAGEDEYYVKSIDKHEYKALEERDFDGVDKFNIVSYSHPKGKKKPLAYRAVHVAMPYYAEGDLHDFITGLAKNSDIFNASRMGHRLWYVWLNHGLPTLFRNLAMSVKFIHDLGVLHLDIKPQNYAMDSKGKVILIDMGLAARLETIERYLEYITPTFRTPFSPDESAHYKEWRKLQTNTPESESYYAKCDDIWSLGKVFQCLVFHRNLLIFHDATPAEFAAVAHKIPYPLETAPMKELSSLLEGMLAPDPAVRFTMDQILAHPYIKRGTGSNAAVLAMKKAMQYKDTWEWQTYVQSSGLIKLKMVSLPPFKKGDVFGRPNEPRDALFRTSHSRGTGSSSSGSDPLEEQVPEVGDFVDARTGLVYTSARDVPGWGYKNCEAVWTFKEGTPGVPRVYVFTQHCPEVAASEMVLFKILDGDHNTLSLWKTLSKRHAVRLEAVRHLIQEPELHETARKMIKDMLFEMAVLPKIEPLQNFKKWTELYNSFVDKLIQVQPM